jgi:GNAT superfamily N-acetyltransferase
MNSSGGLCMRKAQSKELPALLALAAQCATHMKAAGIDQWDEIYPNEFILSRDLQGYTLYVCESQNTLLGYFVLNAEQDPTYAAVSWRLQEAPIGVIHRLMVTPQSQGRGLAKMMMEFAENEARSLGYRVLRLDAFTKNPRALGLYDKLGYQRVGFVQLRKGEFVCFEKSLS